FTEHDRMLLAKLELAWRTGAESIEITDADLAPFIAAKAAPLPASVAAFISLLRDEAGAPQVHFHGWTGASAARLLGRFSTWDEELAAQLREHLRGEEAQAPEAIFAEIAHLPDRSRTANILQRPLLREYEIAFAGRSGADDEHTILLEDLSVSVRSGRVVLWSAR